MTCRWTGEGRYAPLRQTVQRISHFNSSLLESNVAPGIIDDLYVQFALACWVLLGSTWVVLAFGTKRRAKGQSAWPAVRTILLVALVGILFYFGARGAFTDPSTPIWLSSGLIGAFGDIVVLSGLVLSVWSRMTLGGNWSGIVELKEEHELITSGPYRYVRHPIYSGMLLMVLGSAIIYGHASGFLVLIMVAISLWVKSFYEERLLSEHFQKDYPDYKARTKMLIPYLF